MSVPEVYIKNPLSQYQNDPPVLWNPTYNITKGKP